MKFCPNCEVRLKKSESGLICPKCNYSVGNTSTTKKIQEEEVSEFNVLEESEAQETLPSIKIDCKKCGHNEAVWWMLQTRSADEPTTQFYRCTKCNYTWRNYA
ncbi:MAG TPA: transcription factor S [Nitrosopumilaceae archaeon]|nr:transcription factor S [Nitrosopumilaceae archaeon]